MKQVLIVVLTLLIPSINYADCKRTPALCDKLIQEANVLIKEQRTQIKNYEEQTDLQRMIIADKDSQLSSPMRDPIKVGAVIALALVTTGLLTGHLK